MTFLLFPRVYNAQNRTFPVRIGPNDPVFTCKSSARNNSPLWGWRLGGWVAVVMWMIGGDVSGDGSDVSRRWWLGGDSTKIVPTMQVSGSGGDGAAHVGMKEIWSFVRTSGVILFAIAFVRFTLWVCACRYSRSLASTPVCAFCSDCEFTLISSVFSVLLAFSRDLVGRA